MYSKIEKKKRSLNRSYFKLCYGDQPRDPYQCLDYYHEHGERPFVPFGQDEKEIIYNMFVEYQKKNTSDMKFYDQFYTPLKTAKRLAYLIREYGDPLTICDACCGYGSITQFIIAPNYYNRHSIYWFDIYEPNANFCRKTVKWENDSVRIDRYSIDQVTDSFDCIVSNPPFKPLQEFLERVYKSLNSNWYAILLLPRGYMEKERPKALVETINKFDIIQREKMEEKFETTGIMCDIYVVKKKQL